VTLGIQYSDVFSEGLYSFLTKFLTEVNTTDIEDYAQLLGLLVMVGLIFGTFVQWQQKIPFGFDWFVNMLWFAIGFPILFIIASLVFSLGSKGQKKLQAKA